MPEHRTFNDSPEWTVPGMSPVPERLEELTEALLRETGLLRELGETLVEQRGAVAGSDLEGVRSRTEAIIGVLEDLERARSRRGELLRGLGDEAGAGLTGLETVIGGKLPASLERARSDLVSAARDSARELNINHTVLRRVLETGEVFFQTILSYLGEETPSYRQPDAGPRTSRASILVNKVV